MSPKKVFHNSNFHLNVKTNSQPFFNLLTNVIDESPISSKKDIYRVNFSINQKNSDCDYHYKTHNNVNNNLSSTLMKTTASVQTNTRSNTVISTIYHFDETRKEQILSFAFMHPFYFLLAQKRLFFIHASLVSNIKKTLIITGKQNCGKSTIAIILAMNGYHLHCDDDCFLKPHKDKINIIPFSTKMGLNDKIIKRFPELKNRVIKNYSYGNKKRISPSKLNSFSNQINHKNDIVLIFPYYRNKGGIQTKRISKNKALDKLTSDSNNLNYYNKKHHPKLFKNHFWALHSLSESSQALFL